MSEQRKGTAVVVIVLAFLAVIVLQILDLKGDLDNTMRHVTLRKTSMVSSWNSGLVHHTYTTYLGEADLDETDFEHSNRHRTRVANMIRAFPKTEK